MRQLRHNCLFSFPLHAHCVVDWFLCVCHLFIWLSGKSVCASGSFHTRVISNSDMKPTAVQDSSGTTISEGWHRPPSALRDMEAFPGQPRKMISPEFGSWLPIMPHWDILARLPNLFKWLLFRGSVAAVLWPLPDWWASTALDSAANCRRSWKDHVICKKQKRELIWC